MMWKSKSGFLSKMDLTWTWLELLDETWAEAGFGFTKPAFLGSRLRLPRFLRGWLRLRDFQRLRLRGLPKLLLCKPIFFIAETYVITALYWFLWTQYDPKNVFRVSRLLCNFKTISFPFITTVLEQAGNLLHHFWIYFLSGKFTGWILDPVH